MSNTEGVNEWSPKKSGLPREDLLPGYLTANLENMAILESIQCVYNRPGH